MLQVTLFNCCACSIKSSFHFKLELNWVILAMEIVKQKRDNFTGYEFPPVNATGDYTDVSGRESKIRLPQRIFKNSVAGKLNRWIQLMQKAVVVFKGPHMKHFKQIWKTWKGVSCDGCMRDCTVALPILIWAVREHDLAVFAKTELMSCFYCLWANLLQSVNLYSERLNMLLFSWDIDHFICLQRHPRDGRAR